MKTAKKLASTNRRPRVLLNQLVRKLRRQPLKYLSERSVENLSQFFSGYGMFGGPIWRELARFEQWLMQRFYYPPDTGKWDRYIQLNSADNYESYQMFLKLYSQFTREVPGEMEQPTTSHDFDPKKFDFYQWLYWISLRPGMYLGLSDSVKEMAAYFSGYFIGKKDAGLKISQDEKEFLRFESWLWRRDKLKRRYPWHRLVAMWPYGAMDSVENFFAYFDAYLTNYGKRPRGLEDLFEIVKYDKSTTLKRRKKLPKKVIKIPETKRWWRGHSWKPQS